MFPRIGRSSAQPRAIGMAVGAVAISVALTACGGSSGEGSAPSDGQPVSGGTLTVGIPSEVTCLDPQQQSGTPAEDAFTREVVDSLVSQDPKTGEIQPWLATSWTANADASSYTFTLRSGVTFSDGTQLTAKVVAQNLDYVKNTLGQRSLRGSGFLSSYQKATAVDDHTLKVDFSAPAAQFLVGASSVTMGMLAPATMALTPDQRCQGKVVGTGPYVMTAYTPGSGLTLTRRDGYEWAPPSAGHTGDAYLDKIEAKIVPDTNVRAGSLRSGQIDVGMSLAAQDAPGLSAGGVDVVAGSTPGTAGLAIINTAKPGLDDPVVRQAMEKAIDNPSNAKVVFGDYNKPGTSVLSSVTTYYKDESDLIAYDPAEAATMLDSAGYTKGSDGVRAKDGVKLSFGITYSSEWNGAFQSSLLQLVQQNLKDVGIEVKLSDLPRAQFAPAVTGDDPPAIFVLSSTSIEPDIIRSLSLTVMPNQEEAIEKSGLGDLFTRSQAEADASERGATFAKIQDLMVGQGLMFPLYELAQIYGSGAVVHGFALDSSTLPDFYDTWRS